VVHGLWEETEGFSMANIKIRRIVCGEPAAVWWASGQAGLHPMVMRQIQFALRFTF